MLAASLNAFFCASPIYGSAEDFTFLLDFTPCRERNTSCEAANRRNEKKALSAAASFFPFRQLLRGLKGASSPFLVDPARRNRWCFSGSLLARAERKPLDRKIKTAPRYQREIPLKENLALLQQQSAPAREPFLVLFWYTKRTSLYEKSIEEK